MSLKTQENHMRRLAELLAMDLSYIWGEKECGPNGAKKEFLNTGKTFLRALAKDLEFKTFAVHANPGGIGVPGDVSMKGTWPSGAGLYLTLEPYPPLSACGLYRESHGRGDGIGSRNIFLRLDWFSTCGYSAFCTELRRMDKEVNRYGAVA